MAVAKWNPVSVPKREERVRVLMEKLKLQAKLFKAQGKSYKDLLKGKTRILVLALASEKSENVIAFAEKHYRKYPDIVKLLDIWENGSRKTWHEKIGRKAVPHRSGFYPGALFIANVIRNKMINHIRRIAPMKKTETTVRPSAKKVTVED